MLKIYKYSRGRLNVLEREGFKPGRLLLCKVLFVVVLSFVLLVHGSSLAFADENQAADAN